jgi:hypothetical protein
VLVFVAVAVFVPVCMIGAALIAIACPPIATGAQTLRFIAIATAPVAVGLPMLEQVAVALPPTATMLTVLLLDWAIRLDWRTEVTRTER